MHRPLISVIMIVRDGGKTLPLALASLLNQSYDAWECVVINDASADDTELMLDALDDSRFRVRHYATPMGRGQARNEALADCEGDFVATLDCDDFYFSDTLERHIAALDSHPEAAATVGPLLLFDKHEKYLGILRRQHKSGLLNIGEGPQELKLPFGSMVFRRDSLTGLKYNSTFNRSEDRDLYSKALAGRTVYILDTPAYAYRWSLELEKVLAGLRENSLIYMAHFARNPIRACVLVAANRLKFELYQMLGHLGLWDRMNHLRITGGPKEYRQFYEQQIQRHTLKAAPLHEFSQQTRDSHERIQ